MIRLFGGRVEVWVFLGDISWMFHSKGKKYIYMMMKIIFFCHFFEVYVFFFISLLICIKRVLERVPREDTEDVYVYISYIPGDSIRDLLNF